MEQSILVMTNLPDTASATTLGRHLVAHKLAACVNLLPEVKSIYHWQGAVEEAGEVTMLIKSTHARYVDLETAIQALHPYDVPEIIVLEISGGFAPYLSWIEQETKKDVNV
jgi:periplasmic divalent cation tolerance protein